MLAGWTGGLRGEIRHMRLNEAEFKTGGLRTFPGRAAIPPSAQGAPAWKGESVTDAG